MVDSFCETDSTTAGGSRYAASISYDGSAYHGWQRLKTGLPTIQFEVEKALSAIADHEVATVCAGRTDAGVHASRQIIHFDSPSVRTEGSWVFGANHYLPDDIAVNWVKPIDPLFHARFSATARRYIYIIYNHVIRPAHLHKGMTWDHRILDVTRMQEAGGFLIGKHDFNAYRTVRCQARHAVRTVSHLEVRRHGQIITLDVQANAFLHHMIRNIAGVLMQVGCGEKPSIWAKEVLDSKDRRCGGVTAPSYGLYFSDVIYPDIFSLPQEPVGPAFIAHHFK